MAARARLLAHRSEESPVRRRSNASATVVAAAWLLIVVAPAAVLAAPDAPATVGPASPAQDTRPVPVLTLAITPDAVGARGVVTATVSFTPAPATADTGGWIRFTNPATTWGESIRVGVDAAGLGSVEIDTQFWQSGTWTAVFDFPGSAELAPAVSPPASVTITVPTEPPPALDDPRTISIGGRHACALDEAGHLSCWGAMRDGGEALNDGTFRDVSAGGEYTCAIRADGTLTCWGDAPYPQGQQPDGTFLRIVTKDTFGCALRVDGTLGCWGPYEYRDDILDPPHGTFVALSGQSANSCALDADGSPSCWGGPGGVEGMLPGPFDQVAAGSSFACGLRPSGAVECWGLGVGAGFAPAGTYTRISAWGQALCALQTDGSIRCWGDAFDAPPAEIQGEFVDVAAGPEVACARRATGELACFGGESYTLGLVPRVISTPPVIGAVGVPYERPAADDDRLPESRLDHCRGIAPTGRHAVPHRAPGRHPDEGRSLRPGGASRRLGPRSAQRLGTRVASLVGPLDGEDIQLAGFDRSTWGPAAAWNGQTYLVAWTGFGESGRSRVLASEVSLGGALVGPAGGVLLDIPVWATQLRAASGTGGRSALAYDLAVAGPPIGAARRALLHFVDVARTPVTGASVTIAGGAAATRASTVAVATPAKRAVRVALSNDGRHWRELPYAASISWSLTSATYGGTSANGAKTVHVRWQDATGRWTPVQTDRITFDTRAPTATAPVARFVAGSTASSRGVAVRLTWTGEDTGAGVVSYEVARSRSGGPWATVATGLASPVTTVSLPTSGSERFRVRARDRAGNVGAWAAGATFEVRGVSELSSSVAYAGRWTTRGETGAWGGRLRFAAAAGASATYRFTGRSVAWLATYGPTRGSARVYVDGQYAGTVSLRRAATTHRIVAFARRWPTSGPHTLRVVVAGTPGHPRVDVDAFLRW